MIYTGASIRELQLARGLITLRWTSIPLLFGFSLFCLDFLNLSFKFEPIYLLCCALAIFNVYFTVHVSLLSRQMALNSGMSTLKRGLVRIAFPDVIYNAVSSNITEATFIPLSSNERGMFSVSTRARISFW